MLGRIGIDFSQRTTRLGALVLVGVIIALVFLTFSTPEKAFAVMTIIGTASGMLGFAVKDGEKD